MTKIRLMGGIGNQMFQYAFARTHADLYQVPLVLDVSGYHTDPLRSYQLDHFSIRYDRVIRQRSRISTLFSRDRIYRESEFGFDVKAGIIRPPVTFIGYFQSCDYFKDNQVEIRSDFKFKKRLSRKNQKVWDLMQNPAAVSIHFRRGDYAVNPDTKEFHGLLDESYYRSAISAVRSRITHPVWYIFSDDISWVRKAYSDIPSAVFVDWNEDESEDLRLMTGCRHHIIANSTFSWWGAWLSDGRGIHIAPRRWFNRASLRTEHLIPTTWMRV